MYLSYHNEMWKKKELNIRELAYAVLKALNRYVFLKNVIVGLKTPIKILNFLYYTKDSKQFQMSLFSQIVIGLA